MLPCLYVCHNLILRRLYVRSFRFNNPVPQHIRDKDD